MGREEMNKFIDFLKQFGYDPKKEHFYKFMERMLEDEGVYPFKEDGVWTWKKQRESLEDIFDKSGISSVSNFLFSGLRKGVQAVKLLC